MSGQERYFFGEIMIELPVVVDDIVPVWDADGEEIGTVRVVTKDIGTHLLLNLEGRFEATGALRRIMTQAPVPRKGTQIDERRRP